MTETSDLLERLFAGCTKGDEAVWEEILRIVSDRLRIRTRQMLRQSPEVARWQQVDDVFQIASIKLHRGLRAHAPDTPQQFWGLAVSQIRQTLIELTRHYRDPHELAATQHSDGHQSLASLASVASGLSDESSEPASLEDWETFHESVGRLPEEQRLVFELLWYGGLEQDDAADLLDVSVAKIQQWTSDARSLLSTSGNQIEAFKATEWMFREPTTVSGHLDETQSWPQRTEQDHGPLQLQISVDSLLDRLKEHTDIERDTIDNLFKDLVEEESSGELLLGRLVRKGQLSAYQAHSLASKDAMPLQLGDYELIEQIGSGGMGKVYKARHGLMNRLVALKTLPTQIMGSSQAVARFEREVRAAAKVTHPNIVHAYDAGQAHGMHYLVMELVDGVDLAVLSSGKQLPVAESCELICQAASGLHYAHKKGMIHRDIKPSNIMLSRCDGGLDVKILDLGLALIDENNHLEHRDLTSTRQVMGTLKFMAPEQVEDSHCIDHRADIYSLGATLYTLVAGVSPYAHVKYNSPLKILQAMAIEPSPSLRKIRPDLPEELLVIADRMLAKDPDQRFDSAQHLIEALNPFRQGADLNRLVEQTPGSSMKSELTATGLASETSVTDADPFPQSQRASRSRVWIPLGLAAATALIAVALKNSLSPSKLPPDVTQQESVDNQLGQWLTATRKLEGLDKRVAVHSELQRKNPDKSFQLSANWDGKSRLIDEDREKHAASLDAAARGRGVIHLTGQRLADISPLLAFDKIEILQYDELNPRKDAAILEQLSNLKLLNGRSAELYREVFSKPSGAAIDTLWIESVRAIGDFAEKKRLVEDKLRDLNPAFKGSLRGDPSEKEETSNLVVLDTRHITDISPLAALDATEGFDLSCNGHSWLSDLTPLAGKTFSSLQIDGTFVSDLSPLSGVPLKTLRFDHARCSSLRGLESAPLEILQMKGAYRLSDISALAGKLDLKNVTLSGCQLSDITPLSTSSIDTLNLAQNVNLTDLAPLRELPLNELHIQSTGVKSLDPLIGLPLQRISIADTAVPADQQHRFVTIHPDIAVVDGKPRDQFLKETADAIRTRYQKYRQVAEIVDSEDGVVEGKTLLPRWDSWDNGNSKELPPEGHVFRLTRIDLSHREAAKARLLVDLLPQLEDIETFGLPQNPSLVKQLLPAINKLPRLKVLRNLHVPTDTLAPLTIVEQLEEFETTGSLNARSLAVIARMKNLRKLQLTGPRCKPEDFAKAVDGLKQLTSLELFGANDHVVDDQFVQAVVAASPQLKDIHLKEVDITDAALRALSKLPLQSLHLSKCSGISNTGVLELSNLPLTLLTIAHNLHVSDECSGVFESMTNLEVLTFATASNQTIQVLSRLPKLAEVYLMGSVGVDDQAIEHFLKIKNLRILNISGTSITPAGFAHLREHSDATIVTALESE